MNIVIFGAGGHAKTVIDTVESQGVFCIKGLLDGNKQAGEIVYGYEVLGDTSWLVKSGAFIDGIIVAIGDNWRRSSVVQSIKNLQPDLPFVTAIHPNAHVARGASIGEGSVLMAGSVVNSDAKIGEQAILYPGASVDHDSVIGRFVSFAPRAVTGGNVTIGDYSAIAIGAALIHNVEIGQHCVIGAGSTVIHPIPDRSVAYGTPAKTVRIRNIGEPYL